MFQKYKSVLVTSALSLAEIAVGFSHYLLVCMHCLFLVTHSLFRHARGWKIRWIIYSVYLRSLSYDECCFNILSTLQVICWLLACQFTRSNFNCVVLKALLCVLCGILFRIWASLRIRYKVSINLWTVSQRIIALCANFLFKIEHLGYLQTCAVFIYF